MPTTSRRRELPQACAGTPAQRVTRRPSPPGGRIMLTTKDTAEAVSTNSGGHADVPADRAARAGRHRIGRIVAGSLLAGFVAALVLVVGPFGGAPEHVIGGTALLAFAGGWG